MSIRGHVDYLNFWILASTEGYKIACKVISSRRISLPFQNSQRRSLKINRLANVKAINHIFYNIKFLDVDYLHIHACPYSNLLFFFDEKSMVLKHEVYFFSNKLLNI